MFSYSLARYLRRWKPTYTDESASDTMFCAHCGQPAQIFWIDRRENIGNTEPFYNGMHLECYKACHQGHEPGIFDCFRKYPGIYDKTLFDPAF